MNRVVTMALMGVMALMIGAATLPTETVAWRGGHRSHFSHKRSHDRHSHHRRFHHRAFRHRHPRHHHFRHRSHFSLFFDSFYGGYYGPAYPGYYYPGYTYEYTEPVLMYKEAPQKHGYVKLQIFPAEAEVFLDGSYQGKAASLAGRAIPVSPGVHQLRVKLGGFSNYYRLDVSADRTLFFNKTIPATND
jgi:hypothetical protein